MSLHGAIAEAVVLIRADGSTFQSDVVRQGTTAGTKAGSAFGEHFKRRAKVALAAGGAALFAGVAAGLRTGFHELTDYETGLSNLRAGLKSTRDQSNTTAAGMEKLASKIQGYSGQTDDSIVATEQLLLTFTNIRNEAGKNNKIFDQTTTIAADMAQRLGGDASSAAIQLGKALNDPVKGITALTRVGVSFDDQQKKQIATDIKHGQTLKAQKIILAELNKEFGGSARLYGKTLPGQLDRTKRAYEDIAQEVATDVLPYALKFTKWIRKDALPALSDFGHWAKGHKTELEVFAGIIAGIAVSVKTISTVRKVTGFLGSLTGRRGGGLLGGIASKAAPLPVYVTNWGGGPVGSGKTPVPTGGKKRILPGLGVLTLAYAATSGGDQAPGQTPLGASTLRNGPAITSLISGVGPRIPLNQGQDFFSGSLDQPGGRPVNPSALVNNTLTYGTAQQVKQLKELAKTYPTISTALKDYNKQQAGLNKLLVVNPGLAKNVAAANRLVGTSLSDVANTLAKLGPRFVAQAKLLGGDLGHGLIAGIEAQIPHATVAGKILVSQTVKSMRLAAEANSPSRATQRLGNDMGDGLIKGLQQREKALQTQVDKMVGQITNVRSHAQAITSGVRGGILSGASLLNTPNQSIGGIEDFLRHERRIDREFDRGIEMMKKKGYRPGLINTLALAGPEQAGNLVRQLAAAKRSDVAEVNQLRGQIGATARGTAAFVRNDVNGFNTRLDRLHDDLHGLREDLRSVSHEIRGAQHAATHRTHH